MSTKVTTVKIDIWERDTGEIDIFVDESRFTTISEEESKEKTPQWAIYEELLWWLLEFKDRFKA